MAEDQEVGAEWGSWHWSPHLRQLKWYHWKTEIWEPQGGGGLPHGCSDQCTLTTPEVQGSLYFLCL